MNLKHIVFSVLIAVEVSAFVLTAQQDRIPRTKPYKSQVRTQDEGQRIFEQQCSRCHSAPDGISPRISGTIVQHMRIRAQLSRHDTEVLLRFFNP